MATPPDYTARFTIASRSFHAVIFDLDGVVTRTARVHAAAWKQLFDTYLRERSTRRQESFQPFNIDTDYRLYVDGKPRQDGVRSFLESRGITLPEGAPTDAPEEETVHALGNRKNRLFLQRLQAQGVERYESTVALIHQLREHGIRTAIVTSSKNCNTVLQAAGLNRLFDASVDGNDSERLGLKGKPAPDIFLEAARQLNVEPACAIVVEDAIAGVEAGAAGEFGTVIGVDRAQHAEALRRAGANVVVRDLEEVAIRPQSPQSMDSHQLPSALQSLPHIGALAAMKKPFVCLDYDGTLTPIVTRPEDAVLNPSMRAAVQSLAAHCTVAVISGRGLADVRARVGIDGILYAGSHGFQIEGPAGLALENEAGSAFLPLLDQLQSEAEAALAGVAGAQVERKKFSLAIHYRNVQPQDQEAVKNFVDEALVRHRGLRINAGKKVWDIQPDIAWDKGKALEWIMASLKLDSCATLPIHIGDDITDEDAFRAVWDRGIGILVRDEPRATVAQYALDNTNEVQAFIAGLTSILLAGGAK